MSDRDTRTDPSAATDPWATDVPPADTWDTTGADVGTTGVDVDATAGGVGLGAADAADAGPDPDERADLLVVEIERTREEMGGTLEDIGHRLDPARLTNQAKETVREATVGRVEEMVDQAATAAQETGRDLVRTVRENPVPAAMAGIGVWMLWQRFNQSGRSRGYGTTGRDYGTYGGYPGYQAQPRTYGGNGGGGGIQQTAGDVAGRAQQAVGDAASTVQQTAGDVADRAGQAVAAAGATAGDVASEVAWQARRSQDQLTRAIEGNPLAAGLAAVAVGAAVGIAIPTTQQERQVLGQATSTLAERAAETLEQASTRVHEQTTG